MIYHQVKDPVRYQTVFYKQIGLKKHETGDGSGMVLHLNYEDSGMAHYQHVKF